MVVDDRDFMQFPISLPNDGAIDVVVQEPVSTLSPGPSLPLLRVRDVVARIRVSLTANVI